MSSTASRLHACLLRCYILSSVTAHRWPETTVKELMNKRTSPYDDLLRRIFFLLSLFSLLPLNGIGRNNSILHITN